ncbi:MAG: outer membrane beta-barrel protein [Gemmatimonadetes bacterium]|nr:outer membrane beta-barrel protein [Gemmatimonadota bacterium]
MNCLSTSPAALYGCGTGGDGIARGTRGDFGMAGGVEVGLGYVATPNLRLETSIAYRPRFSFEGTANFLQTDVLQSVSADLQSASGTVAAYLDLTAYGPFRVFAGTGAGLHYVDISEFHMTFPRTQTIVPDGRRVDFTVMLAAGVAASISGRITLDLAWRYVNWGIVETGRATGRVIWKDGSREPLELDLAETWAMLRGQGFRVSMRYGF